MLNEQMCYTRNFRLMASRQPEFHAATGNDIRNYDNGSCVLRDLGGQKKVVEFAEDHASIARFYANASHPFLYTMTGSDDIYCGSGGAGPGASYVTFRYHETIDEGSHGSVCAYRSLTYPTRYIARKKFASPDLFAQEKEVIDIIHDRLGAVFAQSPTFHVVVAAVYSEERQFVLMPKAQGDLTKAPIHTEKDVLLVAQSLVACAQSLRCVSLFQADWKLKNVLWNFYRGKFVLVIGDVGGIIPFDSMERTIYPVSTYVCPYTFDGTQEVHSRTRIRDAGDVDRHMQWCIGCSLVALVLGESAVSPSWWDTTIVDDAEVHPWSVDGNAERFIAGCVRGLANRGYSILGRDVERLLDENGSWHGLSLF